MRICKVITCIILIVFLIFCFTVKVSAEEKATESTSIIQQVEEEATADQITSAENTEKQLKEIQEMLLYILAILFFFAIVLIFKCAYNYLNVFF